MPIKQLKRQRFLPRIGTIRLGYRKKTKDGKKGHPVATAHFIVPDHVADYLGTKEPTELRIMFPDPNEERYAPHYYQAWSYTHGLVCKGDGETAERLVDITKIVDEKTGELPTEMDEHLWPIAHRDSKRKDTERKTIICPADDCPIFQAKACKAIMNLMFIMPEVPGLGCYQLNTGSWNTMRNILDQIDFLKTALGRIEGIPLILKRVTKTVRPRETDKPKQVYILELSSDITWEQAIRFARAKEVLALPSPDQTTMPEDLIPDEDVLDGPMGNDQDTDNASGETVPQTPVQDDKEEQTEPQEQPSSDDLFGEMDSASVESATESQDAAPGPESDGSGAEDQAIPNEPVYGNTGELMRSANELLGIDFVQVCKTLEVEKPVDIPQDKLERAWKMLVAKWGPVKKKSTA